MTDFDRDKCTQRNRIAARRDGVEAMPLTVFASAPVVDESRLRYAHGTLPVTVPHALERINASLPDGGTPLTADDVYIHYLEAANDNFVGDRYMFMTAKTLRNIATDADQGVAFMNSHRDGGLSHPADLPMGRTFAGRYEEYTDGRKRTLAGFYMLRGVQPNGANGPSTDDLHRMIGGGTAFDVSVGLYGGDKLCDVCGNTLEDDAQACPHSPGTHRDVTPEQRTAQLARGVKQGRASYSLDDAHLKEVSAVYDGAVPGAGFRKTLQLARLHQLSRADLLEASQAYARLLKQGDLPVDEIGELIEEHTGNALTRFFERFQPKAPTAPVVEVSEMVELIAPLDLTAERERLSHERAELDRQRQEFARQQHWATAEQAVDRLIGTGKIAPAQNLPNAEGHPDLTDALATVLSLNAGLYSRLVAAFDAGQASPPTAERLPVTVLPADPGEKPPVDLEARRRELLAASPLGQRALQMQKES